MNAPRKFLLFIPAETQRSRRVIVIAYYLVFIAFAIWLLWLRGAGRYASLLPLTWFWASMLGGLSFTGPVRLFSPWQRKFADGSAWGIDPGRPHPYLKDRPLLHPIGCLDEHDIAIRDRAHYLAYSTLRWPAIGAALFAPLFLMHSSSEQVAHILFLISVPVAALFFSLPQAIILWTEPDVEPEVGEVPATT